MKERIPRLVKNYPGKRIKLYKIVAYCCYTGMRGWDDDISDYQITLYCYNYLTERIERFRDYTIGEYKKDERESKLLAFDYITAQLSNKNVWQINRDRSYHTPKYPEYEEVKL